MVYTKPSRGCASCKKRKIKCDEQEPACARCLKSGWVCPGYKDEADLNFRNQTQLVVRKAQTRRTDHVWLTKTQWNANHQAGQPQSLPPSVIDRAISFFIHHFVGRAGESKVPARGYHEYLPALLQESSPNSALATITAATGLASLANAGNASPWTPAAFSLYGKAIKQLRAELQDPVEMKSDKTLAAIMLMGIFEAITCPDRNSLRALSHHIIAAARLIELRGPDQFQREVGLRIFLQLRRLIVLHCLQLHRPMPYAVKKWSTWAEPAQRKDELAANRFSELNEDLALIRVKIKEEKITSALKIHALLSPIDKKLHLWRQNLPESWMPKSYRSLDLSPAGRADWAAQYDVFPDLWVASMWNNYHSCRILINDAILSAILHDDPGIMRKEQLYSMEILVEMANKVCHSVPFYLGYAKNQHGALEDRSMDEGTAMPGGYLLMWPLYMAGMLRTTCREQRQWIASKLHQIGLRLGLRIAMFLAAALELEGTSFSDSELWVSGEFFPK